MEPVVSFLFSFSLSSRLVLSCLVQLESVLLTRLLILTVLDVDVSFRWLFDV